MGNAQGSTAVRQTAQQDAVKNIQALPPPANATLTTLRRLNTGGKPLSMTDIGYMKGLPADIIPSLSPSQITSFDPVLLAELKPEQVQNFTNSQLALFTKPNQLNALFGITDSQNNTAPVIIKLTPDQIASLKPNEQISILDPRIKVELVKFEEQHMKKSNATMASLCSIQGADQTICNQRRRGPQGNPMPMQPQYNQPQYGQPHYGPPSYGGRRKNKKNNNHNKKHKTRKSKKQCKKTRRNR